MKIKHEAIVLSEPFLGDLITLIDEAKDAMILTDAQMEEPGPRILHYNKLFTELTGYDNAIGQAPRMLRGPETEQDVIDRLRRNCANGEIFEGKAFNYKKDGTKFVMHWAIRPIMNKDNIIIAFLAIQRDFDKMGVNEKLLSLRAAFGVIEKRLIDLD